MIKYHNVSTHGRPANPAVKRVPTLITSDGNILVGGEVRNWLESMIPVEIENWSSGGILTAALDGGDGGRAMFELDSYGVSMQPMITPELKARMTKDVKDAYSAGIS